MKTLRERFDTKWLGDPNSGCWLWTDCLHHNGYGQISLGRGKPSGRAHRISWELNKGPVPAGALVLHKCDVRSCVNPDHLFLGTPAENMNDMIAKGRAKHPRKFSSSQIDQIRNSQAPQKDIAALFGISQAYVSQIRSGIYRAAG